MTATRMSCGDCHEAEASSVATDVLMPEIQSCQVCHGGEDAKDLHRVIVACREFTTDQPKMLDSLCLDQTRFRTRSLILSQRASAK